ncbi:MAG: virulence factor [SAR324 cluster bacterium]|nr:virulence factor [SAR324 cluster bacterium]MBL7035699.1 virulence factor [SAR324 cluster bacterium]
MAKRTIIYWRDIPSQVIVKQGRTSYKAQLDERFMKAIDKSAMRAGRQGSAEYLEDWRREIESCQGDPQNIVNSTAAELEAYFTDEILKNLVKNKGLKISET